MSSSPPDKRIDPLIDAYRQASELEARISGTRPSAATRAAVLAHARVVAQSSAGAEPKLEMSDAVRATPAANEPKPVWRIAAGVVLGLAGMWVYQLTRPGTTGEANVAVMTAPPSAQAAAVETTAATVLPAPAATQPQSAVAVAAPPATLTPVPAMPTLRAAPSRERVDSSASGGASGAGAGGAARDAMADAAQSETSVARAKVATPLSKTEAPVQVAAAPALAAPDPSATTTVAAAAPTKATGAATSAIPEAATSEPLGEIAIAAVTQADTRKLARAAAAPAPAAPALATAPRPNAFPANETGVIAPSAPPDAGMFNAIRAGNVKALRAAIARGANVNARDEAGRSTLQIAHERGDAEMVKVLDRAGAK